jgi:hypothetical protein
MASKTKHADKWRRLRECGAGIISTWIDEAGVGETTDWADLWSRCIGEASAADFTILYYEEGEELKGARVEAGAALAAGKTVIVVGPLSDSFLHHPRVLTAPSVHYAISEMIE